MDIGSTLKVRNRLEWRRWLAKHHKDTKEIWLVYYKKASGKSGITYEESVLEGLAYGWIDGQNKSIDEETFAARFTPHEGQRATGRRRTSPASSSCSPRAAWRSQVWPRSLKACV